MYICPNCNAKSEEPVNFCFNCGTPMVNNEPQPVEPQQFAQPYQPEQQYQQPQQPVYYAYPPVNKPSLAVKIVGMVLSIVGLVFLSIGGLYTLIGLVEEGLAFAFALVFDLFFLPLSIVGLCLSNKCINAGDYSGMSRAGKTLGIVGIIIAAAALFIGCASLGLY